jgi:hypothetical protein
VRLLLTGWFSFLHGEATAGDVLALEAVRLALESAAIDYDIAWSPVFRPGGLRIDDAAPQRYSHLVFVCGPVRGEQIAALHARYASCRRIAVGVTVIDRADPEYAGFDAVLARDGDLGPPIRDLAAALPWPPAPQRVPVTGILLAMGQGEYGMRRRHETVARHLTEWASSKDCARIPLETRLDSRDWRLCSTAGEFMSLVSRLDLVITTRLHGLVLALRAGVPALAVDPVAGGGKVTQQARAWQWPAILAAQDARDPERLDAQWEWCLSAAGRRAAAQAACSGYQQGRALLAALITDIRGGDPGTA